jgi:hypothetical protein
MWDYLIAFSVGLIVVLLLIFAYVGGFDQPTVKVVTVPQITVAYLHEKQAAPQDIPKFLGQAGEQLMMVKRKRAVGKIVQNRLVIIVI